MRPPTRLQLLSIIGGLTTAEPGELEAALAALYHEHPSRWQSFMDEARVLIDAMGSDKASGFAETVTPID